MKTCEILLVLLCCFLTETQLRGETISDNDIPHQGHDGEAETRENEVMGAAERTEDAATDCTQQTCQPDIHTVLREMSALVAEQRVELRYTKTQMDAMESRLRTSEITVDEQRLELIYTKTQIKAVETRLRTSERLVKLLKSENEAQAMNLNLTASQVEELRRDREDRRVSFSASVLTSGDGNIGPYSAATTLIYRNVISNIGNCYNKNTGVFTAPVRGVFHFAVFHLGSGHASVRSAVALHKNGEHVVGAYTHTPSHWTSSSNGASLLLEVGDVVYVNLRPNAWVYDDMDHFTTFSGHLLFTM